MPLFIPNNPNDQIRLTVEKIAKSIGSLEDVRGLEPLDISSVDEIKNYDITEFIDDLHDFLKQYNESTQEYPNFSFRPSFTYEDLSIEEVNALRYNIVERTPASLSAQPNPHQGVLAHKWICRQVLDDYKNPGYKVLVYTKPFDNTIQLVPWARDYRDANKAAFSLEDQIDTYAYLFKAKGLMAIRYEGRGTDIFRERNNVPYYGCPLIYYVKTYKVKLVYEKILEEIAIQVQAH